MPLMSKKAVLFIALVSLLGLAVSPAIVVPVYSLVPSPLNMQQNTTSAMTFTMSYNPVTSGPSTYYLYSSNPTIASVPPTVTVYPAQTSVTFPVLSNTNSGTTTVTVKNSPSGSVLASADVNVVPARARVIISKYPFPIFTTPDNPGSTTYTLTNIGEEGTQITLDQDASILSQTPATFFLTPHGTQTITVTSAARPLGFYEGHILPRGDGVRSGLRMLMRVYVGRGPATGHPHAKVMQHRVYTAGSSTTVSGIVNFKNDGDGDLFGVAVSDVPWLTPESGIITIRAGASRDVGFTIDRTARPDGDSPFASRACRLLLVYFDSAASAKMAGLSMTPDGTTPPPSGSLATVVDTDTPQPSPSGIPPLGNGEVALFIPGAGHIVGSNNRLFLSDFSILNPNPFSPLTNVSLYYKPLDTSVSTSQANVSSVNGGSSVSLGDVVSSVFNQTNQVGTLQVRGSNTTLMSVSSNVFNANDPKGTFGTAIPVFRSDRSASGGQKLFITGIRRDDHSHTNFYLQETSGTQTTAQLDFYDANGAHLSTVAGQQIGAFGLLQLGNAAPAGAVVAVITNTGSGKLAGYATPLDDASGDTWAVADWSRQYAKSDTDPFVIPVVGALQGAANTYFRTDLSITNIGSSTATGTIRYYDRNGTQVSRDINLGQFQSMVSTDATKNLFNITGDTAGFVILYPAGSSKFAISARTYTTIQGDIATFGTAEPAIPKSTALKSGNARTIGDLEDSNSARVIQQAPGTFRTNFGFVETNGAQVTVRVSVYFSDGQQLAAGGAQAVKEFTLPAYGFALYTGLVKTVLGDSRDTLYGDLHDVQVKFEVISGDGAIIPYISQTDNGTGDTVLRTE